MLTQRRWLPCAAARVDPDAKDIATATRRTHEHPDRATLSKRNNVRRSTVVEPVHGPGETVQTIDLSIR